MGVEASVPSADHMWVHVAGDADADTAPIGTVWNASTSVYNAFLGPEVSRKRPLSRERDFFLSSSRVSPLASRNSSVASRERFKQYWAFFVAWLQTLQKVKAYWAFMEPPLLHMMTRQQVQRAMENAAPYTFLMRFSESQKGCMAITLNYAGNQMDSVLITPEEGSFAIPTRRGERLYPTLAELVSRYHVLQYLPTEHRASPLFAHAANSALAGRTHPPPPITPTSSASQSGREEGSADVAEPAADPRPAPGGWGVPALAEDSAVSISQGVALGAAQGPPGAASSVVESEDVEPPPAPPLL